MPPDPSIPPGCKESVWVIHAKVLHLADGSFLIKPLKPVLRATAKRTAELTGVSLKKLRVLAEAGFIRVARPTLGSTFYYPQEIEAFILQTEADPDFWNKVRTATYLKCARLRNCSKLAAE
jgi:hypothetical protein